MDLTDQTLSHYKIIRKIATGGMGEVYLAQDLKLDRAVAIKVLLPEVSADDERLKRFMREAKTASALKHPNVVPIYEIGQQENLTFIVMEYIEGETLQAKIHSEPLESPEITEIAIQIADALDEAHSKGIIHRDVKSSNIMITPRGQVKILDFGLAKQVIPESLQGSKIDTRSLTEPGLVLGTLQYMSPEQALGKRIDHRSDIFSFGVVLYQMATGRLPFQGETSGQILARLISEAPDAIARFNYKVDPEFERIVRKCLEKDTDRRYQSARDLLIDLRNSKRDAQSGSLTSMKLSNFLSRFAMILIALVAIGAIFYYWRSNHNAAIQSVAVLPFVDSTASPDTEYLSDGITEATINTLSRLPALKVMARSTVFRYRGSKDDPQRIGRELKVDAVVTGTMNRQAQALVIDAELVNVQDGSQIWGQQYTGNVSDVLTLQQNIGQQISEQVRPHLTGEQQKALTQKVTTSPQAYQLYLQGRFYWNKRTPEGFMKAIDYFNQAIEKDPDYALAYAGIADCYVTEGSPFPYELRVSKAQQAVQKALELDDSLAEAHTSKAAALSWILDWKGAEREFQRAIRLNPNYPTAHQWYAETLAEMGRTQEALREMKQALELDPLSMIINRSMGFVYLSAQQYENSIGQFRKTLDMYPEDTTSLNLLMDVLIQTNQYLEAVSEYEKSSRRQNDTKALATAEELRRAYQDSGPSGFWKKALVHAEEEYQSGRRSEYELAAVCVRAGDTDRAFELLKKSYEKKDADFCMLKMDPRFDPVRTDPRFSELVKLLKMS